MNFVNSVYEQNLRSTVNLNIFNDFIKALSFCVKTIMKLFASAVLFACFVPIIVYLWNNSIIEPIVPMVIPGTTLDSFNNYAVNYIDQIFKCLFGSAAYLFFDTLYVILIFHVILLTNILQKKISIINELVLDKKKSSTLDIKKKFIAIIQLHNEMLK